MARSGRARDGAAFVRARGGRTFTVVRKETR